MSTVLKQSKQNPARAAVYLLEQPGKNQHEEQELFIGVYFHPDLINIVLKQDPLYKLDMYNLDAFCVIIEEISHFHMIVQRASAERHVSKLELEWQGEIDKFLITALILSHKNPHLNLTVLQKHLFENVRISNEARYQEANYRAAKFWSSAISQGIGKEIPLTHKNFRIFMQKNLHKSLQDRASVCLSKSQLLKAS